MKFSLITTTLGRTHELDRLARVHRRSRACRDFEVIVVDQNSNEILDPILAPYHDRFPLVRVHSAKGASRGRNVGIAQCQRETSSRFQMMTAGIPPRLLEQASDAVRHAPRMGWSQRPSRTDASRWSERPGRIDRWNVWKRAIEWTMFLRRELVEHVGNLNETLGPGAGTQFGAGEGTEYLIRALAKNFHLTYQPGIEIHHENPVMEFETHVEKSRRYAMGQGRVLQLGKYPTWYAMYHWMRPLAGATMGIMRRRPQQTVVALAVVQGLIGGWSFNGEKLPRAAAAAPVLRMPARRREMSMQ